MTAAKAEWRDLTPYRPTTRVCRVNLGDNTNLFGMPPSAERVLREAGVDSVARYPASYAPGLKRAVATYAGVTPENVTTGCGSDDVIDSVLRALLAPGEAVAFADPTFVMVPVFARVNGLRPAPVPLRADCSLDVTGLLATGARVIYVCAPNNPTGTAVSRASLEMLVAQAPGVVLIDEAYAEFSSSGGFLDLARTCPNVLVTRTMSKAFGLAGMRVGWAVGDAALVAEVEKARGPYKHTAIAEAMSIAVLSEDVPWMRAQAEAAVANRERFREALQGMGLRALASDANFLLVPLPGAVRVAERMRDAGVNVRVFQGLAGLGDALRVSVGPWPLLEDALAALREALRCE
ncbi:aminotransferase class I/II-fold pyridoxal phosphate-dependent enzyme [Myxococcaceae bacterium JPH2]|nr:aminotransferase class I/II-fold pyridoxal phosphate-dependent enzyme [Myxococcaceae bacterium JPH2]